MVTALLLGFKPVLHRWLGALRRRELYAALKLLLVSVVLLPILPDRGYGPWATINPYELWWLVVLVAAISFLGYFAIRLAGARRGALYTGFVAGLASSTALTLHFSRLARSDSSAAPVLGLAILLSCGVMFPRMVLILGVVSPGLVMPALAPLAAMALVIFAVAGFLIWRRMPEHTDAKVALENPLEIRMALGFGALLAVVMVLARALKAWFGDTGVLILAAVSGSANIDAITLSLAGMMGDGLGPRVAVTGLVIAAAMNNLVKGGMALAVGGRAVGIPVALSLVLSALAGAAAAWLWLW